MRYIFCPLPAALPILFFVNVRGGGNSGQAGSIRHGITRALIKYDEDTSDGSESGSQGMRKVLRAAGYVTRDPRRVERKKVGFKKARKKEQYSKPLGKYYEIWELKEPAGKGNTLVSVVLRRIGTGNITFLSVWKRRDKKSKKPHN